MSSITSSATAVDSLRTFKKASLLGAMIVTGFSRMSSSNSNLTISSPKVEKTSFDKPGSKSLRMNRVTQPFVGSHVSPELQEREIPAWHPDVGSHVSSPLHTLPSVQTRGDPGRQPCVASHVSDPLQRSPSSQTRGVPDWQPWALSQVSRPLQTFPSSQLKGVPGRAFLAGGIKCLLTVAYIAIIAIFVCLIVVTFKA